MHSATQPQDRHLRLYFFDLSVTSPNKLITMKIICVLVAIVAIVYAAPQGADKDAVVIKNELDNIGVDGFKWAYETSNGIQAQEQGQLSNVGTDNELLSVRGSYSYKGLDGVVYTVTYVADENGFQPEGAHIPK